MDILDALERKVDHLLEEIAVLRATKARLEQQLVENTRREEDIPEQRAACLARIEELEKSLNAERKLKNQVLERVDSLVRRLESSGEASLNSAG